MNAARRVVAVPMIVCAAWTLFICVAAPGQADPFTTVIAAAAAALAVVVLVLTVLIESRAHRAGAVDRAFRRVLEQSGIFQGEEARR